MSDDILPKVVHAVRETNKKDNKERDKNHSDLKRRVNDNFNSQALLNMASDNKIDNLTKDMKDVKKISWGIFIAFVVFLFNAFSSESLSISTMRFGGLFGL